MSDARRWKKWQEVLADFGDFTLRSDDLDAVLTESCRLVANALGIGHAKVIELDRSDRTDFPAGIKGVATLTDVPIFLPGGTAFGLLRLDATTPHTLDDEDRQFLRIFAMILAQVVDRLLKLKSYSAREVHHRFLLALGDAIRAAPTANEKIEVAARQLGEHLHASRVLWGEYDWTSDLAHIFNGWFADGARPFPTVMRLQQYAGEILSELKAGRIVRVDDVGQLAERPGYAAIASVSVQALLSIPLLVDDILKVNISIHQQEPRRWTDDEVALVQEVAERLWAEVVRARAEAALAASEQKYRTLFDAIDEGLAIVEMIHDDRAEIVDMVFRQVNTAYERKAGVVDVVGRSVCAVLPGVESIWLDRLKHVATTGEPLRIEDYQRDVNRWFEVCFASADQEGRFVATVFNDITARKIAEQTLRDSEERQAFLLKLSDTLRATPHDAIIERAVAMLCEQLQLDLCYVVTVLPDADRADVLYQLRRGADMPQVPAVIRLSDYPQAFVQWRERTLVSDDMANDPVLTEIDRRNVAAMRFGALIAAPVRRGAGNPIWSIVAVMAQSRHWSPSQIALVEETAERIWVALERARADAAVRGSEERFRAMAEQTEVGVAMTDRDAQLLFANKRFAEIAGRSADELNLLSVKDYTHPDDWAENKRLFDRMIADGDPFVVEKRIDREDDAPRWNRISVSPRRDSLGTIVGGVAVIVDITDRIRAEHTLRDSEARFRLIVENARDYAIFTLDAEGRIVDWLPGAKRVFGWSPDEVAGRPVDISFTAEDRAAGVPYAERETARRDGTAPDVRWHVRKDGARIFIDGVTSVIHAEDGTPRGFLKIGQDVTERRAAEQALRESEERFRQFSEASSDILWIRNAETMAFEYVSPAFDTIYGQPRAEVGEELERWAAIIHPDDRDRVLANLRRVRDGERVAHSFRIVRADGDVRWIEDVDFPLHDAEGNISRIGGIGHDATVGKKTAVARDESERRVRTLMEGIPQLVWRSGDAGRWTWSSPQWQDWTGQTQAESHGLGWLDALHPDDREAAMRAWQAAGVHAIVDVEYRVRRLSDGAYVWHHTRSVPVRDAQGGIIEWLGTSTDVHALREMQERQRVLVAELQHRTFNLMAMVRSTADATIRSSTSLDEFKVKFRDRIAALARVQRLLSRLGEEDRVTFDELIRSELEAAGALQDGGNRVTLDGPEGVALRSSTVQTFAMALHELTTNAVKYGALKQPGAQLSVRWHIERRDADPWLHVDWQEHGVVMPPKDAKPQGTGHGRRLIGEALPYQLKAETTYVVADDGVCCTIALPVSTRNPPSSTVA